MAGGCGICKDGPAEARSGDISGRGSGAVAFPHEAPAGENAHHRGHTRDGRKVP